MDVGGFSLDQLMELAGVSVSQAGAYHRAINNDGLLLMRDYSLSISSHK
jgi:hypothetical protein